MSRSNRYLLDTNVVSETRRKQADPRVVSFLATADPSTLYISVLTVGELRKGVAHKQRTDAFSANQLASWVDGLEISFADRIVGIDAPTAKLWGEWSAQRPRPVIDTLLAATALRHGFRFVTRNAGDLEDLAIPLLNPWEAKL